MREKVVLRELAAKVLPPQIAERGKQPYRAPEIAPFFAPGAPTWVSEALSPTALDETDIWDAGRVQGLVRRCRSGRATGMRESMALIGILSTQLWHRAFVGRGAEAYPPEPEAPRVRIDRTTQPATAA
jgi:asparagine synthase (glutamine-hydrolysing)